MMKPLYRYPLMRLMLLAASIVLSWQTHAEVLAPEAVKADLSRLYEGLKAAEADLFAETAPAIFERRYKDLMQGYDRPQSMQRLHSDFQQFAALANHAHTRLTELNPGWSALLDSGGKIFPLGLTIAAGEVIVSGAPDGSGVLPGDRVLAINGVPNPLWLKQVTAHISAETSNLAYALLSGMEPYYFWLAFGALEQYTLELERSDQIRTVSVDTVALDALADNVTLEAGFRLAGREHALLSENIGYLRPGPFYNVEAKTPEEAYDPAALADYLAFIDRAFGEFIAAGVEHLVLDLRDNPGGDSSFSDPLIAWFAHRPFSFASDFRIRVSGETTAANQRRLDLSPHDTTSVSAQFARLYATAREGEVVSFEFAKSQPRSGQRFAGQVHVLVNRYSYSNAVSVAALIQDYGFGLVYGEPTRDMATTYGAMEHFTLPNTGFTVGYPKAHIIRPSGKKEVHPLVPDVPLTVPPLRGASDVMLQALLHRLQAVLSAG